MKGRQNTLTSSANIALYISRGETVRKVSRGLVRSALEGSQREPTPKGPTSWTVWGGGRARLQSSSLAQYISQIHAPVVLNAAVGADCFIPCCMAVEYISMLSCSEITKIE